MIIWKAGKVLLIQEGRCTLHTAPWNLHTAHHTLNTTQFTLLWRESGCQGILGASWLWKICRILKTINLLMCTNNYKKSLGIWFFLKLCLQKITDPFVSPDVFSDGGFPFRTRQSVGATVNSIRIRGCSQIMSAKNGGILTPRPPFISQCQHLPDPPSPLMEKTSLLLPKVGRGKSVLCEVCIKGVPAKTRPPKTLNCSKSKTCRARKLILHQPV